MRSHSILTALSGVRSFLSPRGGREAFIRATTKTWTGSEGSDEKRGRCRLVSVWGAAPAADWGKTQKGLDGDGSAEEARADASPCEVGAVSQGAHQSAQSVYAACLCSRRSRTLGPVSLPFLFLLTFTT